MLDIADKTHPLTYEDLEGSDIVIGPVSGNDISKLLENFPSSSMIVSPLDPKVESLAADNHNLIQAPTPAKAQYVDMTEWVKEDMAEGDTVVVITEKAFKQSEAAKLMMEVIDSSGIAYNPFSYNILEGRDVVDTLKVLMARQGTSRVMIASESEAFVNDVVRNMNLMLYEQYKVVLYAPSKIRSFETIEVEHFHKTNMHVSLTYYIDYEDQRVKDFLLKYRALFNTEPSQFAFQGYDIASYFINLCNRYGDRWTEMVDNAPQAMLQSTFRCKKIDENGGYINNGIRRIIYDDGWSVYELKRFQP
jgi:ABC-type branched-subunit amino acid transport system substrate-binding protein